LADIDTADERYNMLNKICLINPPCEWKNSVRYASAIPYQGSLSIATNLYRNEKNLDITFLDGNILSLDEIKKRISRDAQVFGLSAFVYNYRNTLNLVDYIKALAPDAKVVLGGGLASNIPDLILQNRKLVDYVVVLEGEQAMLDVVRQRPLSEIKNFVYRDGNRIIETPSEFLDLDALPFVDYKRFADLTAYYQNAAALGEKRKLPLYVSKGCKWRELIKKESCIFCCIMYPTFRKRDPAKVWDEIRFLHELGAEECLDAADNFLEDMDWFNEFHALRPRNPELDIDLKVYDRAENITNETVKKLRDLRVTGVLIGIESNSNKMLESFHKTARKKDNERALRLLRANGIMPRITMILGGIGETKRTAEETLNFSQKYLGDDCWVTCSILKPLPGSKAFDMILSIPEVAAKYANEDLIDYDVLSEEWVRHFCKVDYDTLLNIENIILKLSTKNCSWDNSVSLKA
jgi:radical SAM superfamily enzyme YgiQ (UPF0313 family)